MEGQTSAAAEAVQRVINATERVERIKYALRSMKERGGTWLASDTERGREQGIYARQIVEALTAEQITWDNAAEWKLRQAQRDAREELKAAKDARKAVGTARQIRLALAA